MQSMKPPKSPMVRSVLAAALSMFPIALAAQEAADPARALVWPGFRGPRGDGVAAGAKPPVSWDGKKNLLWRTALPGAGSSSPIVVGDRVYVTCYSGFGTAVEGGGSREALEHHLVCVSLATGEILFTKTVKGALAAAPRPVQVKEHGFATPTPVSDGRAVYAYFGPAGVVAFALDGEIRWQAPVGAPSADAAPATNRVERQGKALDLHWGAAASPVLHGGLVIVNASEESHSIRAYDRETGELVWRRESANLEGCATTPAIVGPAGAEACVLVLGGEVWALDPKTGALRWRVETGTRGGMSPTPLSDGRLLYAFGGGDTVAVRLGDDVEAGERIAWKGEQLDIPSAVRHGKELILVRMGGIVVRLAAETGEVVHKGRLAGGARGIYASPVVAGDRLYVVTRRGGTFVYEAGGEHALLAKNRFEDDESDFNASPAVSGDRLLLRSDRHLYCIGATRTP